MGCLLCAQRRQGLWRSLWGGARGSNLMEKCHHRDHRMNRESGAQGGGGQQEKGVGLDCKGIRLVREQEVTQEGSPVPPSHF